MIREWWDRQMGARRVAGLALAAVSLAVCVLAMGAAFAFIAPGNQDAGGFARYSAAFGGSIGFAYRAYLLHRHAGTRNGLLWAVVQGGSMALLLFGMVLVATAISPTVGRNAALGGDTWMGVLAAGVVLGLVSAILWERNSQRRRFATGMLLTSGFIIGGLIGLRAGGPWTAVGAISLAVGFVAFVAAMAEGIAELRREMAETAA